LQVFIFKMVYILFIF